MSLEIHIEWRGKTHLVGRLHTAERERISIIQDNEAEWLLRNDAFAIDPASLPFTARRTSRRDTLWCVAGWGPDRWGRVLSEQGRPLKKF